MCISIVEVRYDAVAASLRRRLQRRPLGFLQCDLVHASQEGGRRRPRAVALRRGPQCDLRQRLPPQRLLEVQDLADVGELREVLRRPSAEEEDAARA